MYESCMSYSTIRPRTLALLFCVRVEEGVKYEHM